jgi:hypothetical protein
LVYLETLEVLASKELREKEECLAKPVQLVPQDQLVKGAYLDQLDSEEKLEILDLLVQPVQQAKEELRGHKVKREKEETQEIKVLLVQLAPLVQVGLEDHLVNKVQQVFLVLTGMLV